MKSRWTLLKSIIAGYEKRNDLFLSLLDEQGNIISANSRMIRSLQIRHPRRAKVNFFDLLHPVNQDEFRRALNSSGTTGKPQSAELYVKNGYYHPMRWEVVCIDDTRAEGEKYFCSGYKLLDSERNEKFNRIGSQNYQHIVEGLNEGVLLQDYKGEIISVNQRTAEIFDTSLQRLYELKGIGQIWDTAWEIKDDKGEKVLFNDAPFMKALATEKLCSQVLSIRLRNGDYRKLRFISQPLVEHSKPGGYSVISSITDITEQEELSIQLKEKDMLFSVFMKNTPNLAWVVDEDANLVVASRSFYQHFNIDEHNSEGRKIRELVPAEICDVLFKKHMQVLEKGETVGLVEKHKWADGTTFIFHINIFPFKGVSGKKMLGGHAVNVAEKYAVEKQLRETNERLLLLSRASTNAIWEWDMQSGYIFRNDALMDMIGYPQEETKGLSWWLRRIHPEDRNRVSDKVKESTDAGHQSWEDEYRFKCADGTYKHMLDKGFIVYENGLPVRMIGSLQDVTDMKEMETELVKEKIAHQKEISETVIRVQEKERTRIGHELHDNVNQILSTTKLFVDLLTPATGEERMIKEKSITYLLMAIEEIRKLSRELVTPELQENGLIKSVKSLVDDLSITTKLAIRFTHDNDVDLLSQGKKVALFRIIQEQLKNIVTHSKASMVELLLQKKEDNVLLLIKDNGKGFNVKQSSKGIGLSNIYKRAQYYNGRVNLKSSPGEGCLLEITLPFDDQPDT